MLKIFSIFTFISSLFSNQILYVAPEIKKPTTIIIVGDMMFDRQVRSLMEQNGFDYPFEKINLDADMVIGNLEGTITDNTSIANSKVLRFTFDPQIVKPLSRFTAVSLANNHSRDFGYKGYIDTIKNLGGIGYFGDWENKENLSYTKDDVAFIGFNEFSYRNFDKVLNEISSSTAKFKIVMPHWGVEYEKEPSTFQKNWAHKMIDAGADAVIGSHPHVVQTTEWYKGKPIVYSLGNFIFDQNFSEEVKRGMAVKITLDSSPVYQFIDLYSEMSQVRMVENNERKQNTGNHRE